MGDLASAWYQGHISQFHNEMLKEAALRDQILQSPEFNAAAYNDPRSTQLLGIQATPGGPVTDADRARLTNFGYDPATFNPTQIPNVGSLPPVVMTEPRATILQHLAAARSAQQQADYLSHFNDYLSQFFGQGGGAAGGRMRGPGGLPLQGIGLTPRGPTINFGGSELGEPVTPGFVRHQGGGGAGGAGAGAGAGAGRGTPRISYANQTVHWVGADGQAKSGLVSKDGMQIPQASDGNSYVVTPDGQILPSTRGIGDQPANVIPPPAGPGGGGTGGFTNRDTYRQQLQERVNAGYITQADMDRELGLVDQGLAGQPPPAARGAPAPAAPPPAPRGRGRGAVAQPGAPAPAPTPGAPRAAPGGAPGGPVAQPVPAIPAGQQLGETPDPAAEAAARLGARYPGLFPAPAAPAQPPADQGGVGYPSGAPPQPGAQAGAFTGRLLGALSPQPQAAPVRALGQGEQLGMTPAPTAPATPAAPMGRAAPAPAAAPPPPQAPARQPIAIQPPATIPAAQPTAVAAQNAPPPVFRGPLFPPPPTTWVDPAGRIHPVTPHEPTANEVAIYGAAGADPDLENYIRSHYTDPQDAAGDVHVQRAVALWQQKLAATGKSAQSVQTQLTRLIAALGQADLFTRPSHNPDGSIARNADGTPRTPLDALTTNTEWAALGGLPLVGGLIGPQGPAMPFVPGYRNIERMRLEGDPAASDILELANPQTGVRALGDVGNISVPEQAAVLKRNLPNPGDTKVLATNKLNTWKELLGNLITGLSRGEVDPAQLHDMLLHGGNR